MNTPIKALAATTIGTFSSQIRGEIVMPSGSNYDEERKLYNSMMNKLPGMIVKCTDVADVMACVNFGRENKVLISVRCGGHNVGGLGFAR